MAETAFCRQLQKCFKTYSPTLDTFKETVRNNKDLLSTISNLSEQYSCCFKVDMQTTPLRKYPGIKERTLAKIQTLLEDHVKTLWTDLSILEASSSQVTRLSETTGSMLERYSETLTESVMAAGHVMWPSLQEMFQFVKDAARLFRTEYMRRMYLLENIKYTEEETIQALKDEWTDLVSLNKYITEILAHVQYFVEEKF